MGRRGRVILRCRAKGARGDVKAGLGARGDDGLMQPHERRAACRLRVGRRRARDDKFTAVLDRGDVAGGWIVRDLVAATLQHEGDDILQFAQGERSQGGQCRRYEIGKPRELLPVKRVCGRIERPGRHAPLLRSLSFQTSPPG